MKAWNEGGGAIDGALYRLAQLAQLGSLYTESGAVDRQQLTNVWPAFRMLRIMVASDASTPPERMSNLIGRVTPAISAW